MNAPVSRANLLIADISPKAEVTRVEIQQITMAPGVKAPLHIHPCPTMGVITAGEITFQIEGEIEKILRTGDAFYEPANVRIAKFNNTGTNDATFVAHYLLSKENQSKIELIEKK